MIKFFRDMSLATKYKFAICLVFSLILVGALTSERVSSPMFVEVPPEVAASPEVEAEVNPWQSLGSYRGRYREFKTEYASCVVFVATGERSGISCVPLKLEAK